MSRWAKVYWCLLCMVVGVAVISAILLSRSIKGPEYMSDVTNELDDSNMSVYYMDSTESNYFNQHDSEDVNYNSLDELEKKASIIVRVKVENERKMYLQAVKTKVKVLEVYKGELQINSDIFVYEPSNLLCISYSAYTCCGGYQLMQQDTEYVMFLRNLDKPEGYSYRGDEEISYLPISCLYGKYSVKETGKTPTVISEDDICNQKYTYSEISQYPVLCTTEEELNSYKTLLEQVKQKYIK